MDEKPDLIVGEDGLSRCWWCGNDPIYVRYHDEEWGQPTHDDRTLFEKICLEGFQAGLSWITILRKRENFRAAFDDFDFHKVAQYTQDDVQRLLQDASIIRHRGKIEATINNAQCALHLIENEGSLSKFFWSYQPQNIMPANSRTEMSERTTCDEAIKLSKDLKKRGWKFVGPTTVYAFMQAMGLVNDHLTSCHMHGKIAS